VVVAAFEMHLKLLRAEYLMDDAEFWQTEQHVETLEVHEHGFLLLWQSGFPAFCEGSCACQ
jgi:hypothetical protein